jgi:hypothetical protein
MVSNKIKTYHVAFTFSLDNGNQRIGTMQIKSLKVTPKILEEWVTLIKQNQQTSSDIVITFFHEI